MTGRILPDDRLARLAAEHGTPLYVHRVDRLPQRVASLGGFDVVRFAVKANSSIAFLRRIRAAGAHVDCVSPGELRRVREAGFAPSEIAYTADLFARGVAEQVVAAGVRVNIGSADMIEQYAEAGGREPLTIRLNPGFGHGHDRKVNTGGERSKHGIWHEELGATVERARRAGLEVAGLHMHIGSGSNLEHLARVCDAMEAAALAVGDAIREVSAGGGLPTPYRVDDEPLDVAAYTARWRETRARIAERLGHPVQLEVEPGRFLTAPDGILVCEVRAVKHLGGAQWAIVDGGFHTLARPMMYGAFHRIHALERDEPADVPTVVAGPLCEAADVLTQDAAGSPEPQLLSALRVGDLLCIHDTGAYGAVMASNYNTMPLPAEVHVDGDEAHLVRRAQRIDELLAPELELLAGESA